MNERLIVEIQNQAVCLLSEFRRQNPNIAVPGAPLFWQLHPETVREMRPLLEERKVWAHRDGTKVHIFDKPVEGNVSLRKDEVRLLLDIKPPEAASPSAQT